MHLGDAEIWNTGLALRRRESALLVPQSGAEALLPLQGGGRHGEGGVVRRHLLNKVETRNRCRHLTWTGMHLRGEVRRATEQATSQVGPCQGKLGQAQADLNLSLPLPLS